jgi:hypothetical protein
MSLTKLLVSNIPAGDGKIANFFYSVIQSLFALNPINKCVKFPTLYT